MQNMDKYIDCVDMGFIAGGITKYILYCSWFMALYFASLGKSDFGLNPVHLFLDLFNRAYSTEHGHRTAVLIQQSQLLLSIK